ncbi:MAG TPA: CopG family transcriptional regulator [Cyanobacteria bacterium UBA11369]|nr:CopG family transcriptional regulator [Cyanobacteria bacterium UBA11371]HBE31161.1 CopG family transcriptional regulator [Cyanobacteria bacterium UBA11368]HBE47362.1 CopG family transcriptional regulator [Cyanobacteria bacterium UBA11369]
MKALNVRFSDKEHENLKETSQRLERSINDLVREAVREYLLKLGASNPEF